MEPPTGAQPKVALVHRGRFRSACLLDGPQVAVRILKENVARAHRALGPELLYVAHRDAAAGESLPRGIDALDHERDTLDRAGFAQRQALADHDRTGRAAGRHRHDAHPIPGAHVMVEVEADLLGVEGLRGVDVRDRDGNDLELHLDACGRLGLRWHILLLARSKVRTAVGNLERETRLELATSTLGRSRSTN